MQSQRPVRTGPEAQDDAPARPGGAPDGAAPAGPEDHHRGGAGEEPRPAGRGGPVDGVARRRCQRRRGGDGDGGLFDHCSDTGYSREAAEEASDAQRAVPRRRAPTSPRASRSTCCGSSPCSPSTSPGGGSAELLVRNLDEHGFPREPPETLVAAESRTGACSPRPAPGAGPRPGRHVREGHTREPRGAGAPAPFTAPPGAGRPGALRAARAPALPGDRERDAQGARGGAGRDPRLHPDPRPSARGALRRDGPRYVVPDAAVVVQDGEFIDRDSTTRPSPCSA